MGSPLVSILMTAYNREKYIGAAIDSVLASTYPHFELIVVDDCSTDRTIGIVKEYALRDNRVRLFVNARNLGQFANRNLAATYATGAYLKYLDSDDLIYPTGLQVLVEMMERFPEAGYGLCSLEQDDDAVFPFVLNPRQAYERHFWKGIPLFHKAPLSSIIRAAAFSGIGGFTNPHGEGDYEMWLALSSSHPVVLMPHGVVWYRVHAEQIDFQRRTDPFLGFRYFLVTLRYLGAGCPMDPAQAATVASETWIAMAKITARSFFRHSPAKAAQMYKAAGFNIGTFIKWITGAVLSKFKRHRPQTALA